jgi:uncharacterized membrane protein
MSPEIEKQLQSGMGCLTFRSRPNCSLSEQHCKKVFWAIAGVTFAIALAFSVLGCWLILPFAGLEIGVLAWVFEGIRQHRQDYESLEIVGEELLIESRQGGRTECCRMNRHWARMETKKDAVSGHVRLALRSHGRETEIGLFLNDEDRLQLGGSLRAWLMGTT